MWPGDILAIKKRALFTILPCKAERQYLLSLQVSTYCLLALLGRIDADVVRVIIRENTMFDVLTNILGTKLSSKLRQIFDDA